MPPPRREPRTTAFTLIELLTVISVLALLATITVGTLQAAKQRAFTARAKAEMAILAEALEAYKRHYGDYPQTGPSAARSQIVTLGATGLSVGPGLATAQALLFNSLTGVYGPSGTIGGRINGPMFVDVQKLRIEVDLVAATFGVPTGSPPAKPAVNNAFLDPWGNRYLYFYKRGAAPPAPGRPAPPAQPWSAPAYVLYSTGPDGLSTTLPGANGAFTANTQTTGDNADNIYADKLQ